MAPFPWLNDQYQPPAMKQLDLMAGDLSSPPLKPSAWLAWAPSHSVNGSPHTKTEAPWPSEDTGEELDQHHFGRMLWIKQVTGRPRLTGKGYSGL